MSQLPRPTALSIRSAFEKIYSDHAWLGDSKSGPGSDPARTVEFRRFLRGFLGERGIRSVVDLGCGDWSYARLVDWSGIDYVGLDIVQSVVESNSRNFGRSNVSFRVADPTCEDLPQADLLIAKEVLQHLPTEAIHTIINKARSFRFALFVNDIAHEKRGSWRDMWRWRAVCPRNVDIRAGEYRLLALREAPFCLQAKAVLTYENRYRDLRWTKEVLLWQRDSSFVGVT